MLIVRFEWVITMNCDLSRNSPTMRLNLSLFASSRAASTSSRMANGDGRLRASLDLDARLENIQRLTVRRLFENDVGLAAAEQLAEQLLEVPSDGLERLGETLATFLVEVLDQLHELLLRGSQVGMLLAEEAGPLLKFLLLGDGVQVHIAQPLDLQLEFLNFRLDRRPVLPLLLVLVAGVALGQIDAQFVADAGDQVLKPDAGFLRFHPQLIELLFGFIQRAAFDLGPGGQLLDLQPDLLASSLPGEQVGIPLFFEQVQLGQTAFSGQDRPFRLGDTPGRVLRLAGRAADRLFACLTGLPDAPQRAAHQVPSLHQLRHGHLGLGHAFAQPRTLVAQQYDLHIELPDAFFPSDVVALDTG